MKKRNLSFICAAALVLTMTACSNTTTTSTTRTSTSVESETTEAVASTDDSSTASDASQVQADASSGQSGDQNAPSDPNGTPPEKPDDDNAPGDSNGTPPDKPDGDNAGQPGGGFGSSGEVTQGDSANTIDSDGTYSNESYNSTGDDENALRVDGATVTIKNASDQTLDGDIVVDTISTLDMTLSDNSTFNGTINFNGYTITLADGTVLK